MVLLFLLILFNPTLSIFLFGCDDFIQGLYFFLHLLLSKLRLSLHTLLFGLKGFQLPLVVNIFLLQIIDLSGSLVKSIFFDFEHLLKTFTLLFFFLQLDASLVPDFIRQMEFLCCIVEIIFGLLILLHHFRMINFQAFMLNL